ncbi:ATP-binding cassette sub-family B member 6, mitochondrial [Arthrobacter sp. Hiyo4]|nr:ATP-binding cassette sub-family B member 6, mitochondrial [Arthrobacter sp. Hiyo4]
MAGGEPVFSGASATAGPGTWLAVTGPSGAGKSTLLAVLLGFLPVATGRAAVTGTAAWCPQEAHLFDSTLRGNLMLGVPAAKPLPGNSNSRDGGAPAAGDAGLEAALAAVGLSALVSRLPAGLDTRIGPGGSFLSGGERQRLAVARTLLTGPRLSCSTSPRLIWTHSRDGKCWQTSAPA